MVKLIRLTSRSNNGVFRAQLQNDLFLNPDSRMSVLNLTFRTNTLANEVTIENNLVSFTGSLTFDPINPNMLQPAITAEIPKKDYSDTTYTEFVEELERTLNRTLDASPVTLRNLIRTWNTVYSEFYIPKRPSDFLYQNTLEIHFRYAMLITPLGGQGPVQTIPEDSMTQNDPAWIGSRHVLYDDATGMPTYTDNFNVNIASNVLQLRAQFASVPDTRYKMVTEPDMPMCKGAGLYFTRIQLLTDNGSGGQNNGFGIGLTTYDLASDPDLNIRLDTVDIPGTHRQFEIRCNRPGESYKFINNGGNEQDSGFNVQKTLANQPITDHDIIWFQINRGFLVGGIWYDDGANGKAYSLFTHELTEDEATKGFYPYLYMRGQPAHCVAEGMSYSSTSFISQNGEYEITGRQSNLLLNEMVVGGETPARIGEVIPLIDPNRLSGASYGFVPNQTTSLKMNLDIWRMFGYSQFVISDSTDPDEYKTVNRVIGDGNGLPENPGDGWVSWIAESARNERAASENYIVEILDVATDSYDASRSQYETTTLLNRSVPNKGRRKNILMTIPVNHNTTDTIQYDSNTPIFINLKNTNTINLRNMTVRVLDKNFNQIRTIGESILTLLVEN